MRELHLRIDSHELVDTSDKIARIDWTVFDFLAVGIG
jgi:hypothetical protein